MKYSLYGTSIFARIVSWALITFVVGTVISQFIYKNRPPMLDHLASISNVAMILYWLGFQWHQYRNKEEKEVHQKLFVNEKNNPLH